MGPELQIAANTPHQLLVTNPVQFFWWGTYATLATDLLLSITVFNLLPAMADPKRSIVKTVLLLSPLAAVVLLVVFLGWRHTLEVDWDKGQATTTSYFLGAHVSTHTLNTAEIQRAIIQYDRMGQRIALTLNNGGIVTPLGTGYNFKQMQYVVVESINDGLKLSPGGGGGAGSGESGSSASGSSASGSGASGSGSQRSSSPAAGRGRKESGVEQMEREEREFEQRLDQQRRQGGK